MIYGYKRRKIITLPSELWDTLESFAYSRNLSVSELVGTVVVAYNPDGIDRDYEAYKDYDKAKRREYEDERDRELEEQMLKGYL